jgi:hypothetical protein
MFRVQLGGRHGVGLKEQTAEGDIGRRSGVWNPRDGDQKEVVVTYPKTSLHRVLLPKARVNRSRQEYLEKLFRVRSHTVLLYFEI